MDIALKEAEAANKTTADGTRDASKSSQLTRMTEMLSSVPGAGDLAKEAGDLQARSDAQEHTAAANLEAPPSSHDGPAGQNIPGTNIDPIKTARQIYPILEFRDKVVKIVSATIEKIPGLEALVEKISETITLFVLSLLAPYIRPIINAVSKQLKAGSGGVIDSSGKHQYEPWTDPHCSDPTHSLLSKDHFSNILNEPAGLVASSILQYVAPRVIYGWQHLEVPVEQILNDVARVFHHPAFQDQHCQLHRDMFSAVERWAHSRPGGGSDLNVLLSSESVRHGRNLTVDATQQSQSHSHGGLPSSVGNFFGSGSQSKTRDGPWEQIGKMREVSGSVDAEGRESGVQLLSSNFSDMESRSDTIRPQSVSPQPPSSPGFGYGYSAASEQPAPPPGGWSQPSYPSGPGQGPPQPPYNQSQYDQQPPNPQYPNYGGYPPQPPQYGYGYPPQFGYDPNAPPPPQGYGYGGPPAAPYPPNYYGGPPY